MAYLVYKYKLLFVFYKPAESRGEAWPITFRRLMWGVLIFQVFMTGIFTLKKSFVLSSLMAPLIAFTVWWAWYINRECAPLSSFVSLSSVFEVQRGEATDEVVKLRTGHPVSLSQSHLNKRRYAQNDETLYVAPEDERTDYSQQPMANWYDGVLNTGKRRYGHPALTGVLPTPWLPLKKGQTLANTMEGNGHAPGGNDAVVLTLRRKISRARKDSRPFSRGLSGSPIVDQGGVGSSNGSPSEPLAGNPWQDSTPLPSGSWRQPYHRLSFDHATGVIMLPDDGDWMGDDESDSDADYTPNADQPNSSNEPAGEGSDIRNRHRPYFHHPERRKSAMPGEFPRSI